MKRILVPTDFSNTAKKAFHFALDLAKRGNATVYLYHNYSPIESPFIDTEEIRKKHNSQTEVRLAKRLNRLKIKAEAIYVGVPVLLVLDRSPLIDHVLNFVIQNNIDLIVMGTQGARGIRKTIIGTIAFRIVKNTAIPVLLIPGRYKLKVPEQIVFATDSVKAKRQVLFWIFFIAKLYSAKLTVLHLGKVKRTENEKANFDNYALDMQNEFSDFTLNFQLIKTVSPIETMKTLYRKVPCDLVVMIRRNKPFWERFFMDSFTEQTAYATHLPLLVLTEQQHPLPGSQWE